MAHKAEETGKEEERTGNFSILAIAMEWLHRLSFLSTGAAVLLSPWAFASVERWWFWPMFGLFALSFLLTGAACLLDTSILSHSEPRIHHRHMPLRAFVALGLCLPFAAYLLGRLCFPSGPNSPMVAMEAERSALLMLTPVGIGLVQLLSSRPRWRHTLLWLLLADIAIAAVYGLVNHFLTDDTQILWVAANDFNYRGRLSGPFYCPNHWSAWVGAGICLLLGAACTAGVRWWKALLFAVAAAALLPADFLSLSRGGVASLVVAVALVLPFLSFRGRAVWKRAIAAAVVVAAVVAGALYARYGRIEPSVPVGRVASIRFVDPWRALIVAPDGTPVPADVFAYEDGGFKFRDEAGVARFAPTNLVKSVSFRLEERLRPALRAPAKPGFARLSAEVSADPDKAFGSRRTIGGCTLRCDPARVAKDGLLEVRDAATGETAPFRFRATPALARVLAEEPLLAEGRAVPCALSFRLDRDPAAPSAALATVERADLRDASGATLRTPAGPKPDEIVFTSETKIPAEVLGYANGRLRYASANPLMRRLSTHPLWRAWEESWSVGEFRARLADAFWHQFDRGIYIASALRAWRSNPVWGIGPGQHSNRWAEFAATPDGVVPQKEDWSDLRRPRQINDEFHLYEVHSDWTQLLEEFGIVGLALFLIPVVGVVAILVSRQRRVAEGDASALARSLPLGALLCVVMIALQSFGDFSLQTPAVVWTLSFVVSAAILESGQRH